MDPGRIRAYLQVACAGLGFEIGEIWWTQNEHGSSTVAAIKSDDKGENGEHDDHKKLRFVQLYTSKSYADRRNMLVKPDEEEQECSYCENANAEGTSNYNSLVKTKPCHSHSHGAGDCSTCSQEKHVLSPRFVEAISETAQVVWANTLKQEGLTGRSDIPLHTAVGMPVAMDSKGNMCVVVMFSPNNIESTDEAMEYLQSISMSATSSNIPCLLPAFDRTEDIRRLPLSKDRASHGALVPHHQHSDNEFGEGVVTKFVPIDECGTPEAPVIHGHDLASAPKDCFGIPMLPSFAELGNSAKTPVMASTVEIAHGDAPMTFSDVFDEASYGVWSTIMRDNSPSLEVLEESNPAEFEAADMNNAIMETKRDGGGQVYDPNSLVRTVTSKRSINPQRKERLEEFCTAFLNMSAFDIADVWVPAGPDHPDCLSQVTSICQNKSDGANEFKRVSGYKLIKFWNGAVGRAYSSGNPVWSCNPDVFVDEGRASAFKRAKILTAFAVPVFSGKQAVPSGVVCCYSLLQSGSVPFVLKFVQQALHLLWTGLDKVQPHESAGHVIWQDVGPADLGEMAADVEMQHHFINKKRRRDSVVEESAMEQQYPDSTSEPLATQMRSLDFSEQQPQQSEYSSTPTVTPPEAEASYDVSDMVFQQRGPTPEQQAMAFQQFQAHVREAVISVGEALPFHNHTHVASNSDGSKRAHVMTEPQAPRPRPPPPVNARPLHMPHALPKFVMPSSNPQRYQQPHTAMHTQQQTMQEPAPSIQPMAQNSFAQPQAPIAQNFLGGGMPVSNTASTYPPSTAPQLSTQPSQITQNLAGGVGIMQNTNIGAFAQSQMTPNFAVPPQDNNMYATASNQQWSGTQSDQNKINGQFYAFPPNANGLNAMDGGYEMSRGPPLQQPEPSVQPIPVMSDSSGFCAPVNGNFQVTPQPLPTNSTQNAQAPGSGKVCRIIGCDDPCVERRPYCQKHSGNRLCEHDGCTKCAQGSTRFCIAHGGGRRCTFAGCDRGARDKFFCAAHGGGKRCKTHGCGKSAVGGSSLCTAHGGGKRCAIEGCEKSAQSSTKYCVKHGGGKKCCYEGCEKVARGRTNFCAAHGGGVRCKLDGCTRVAIGRMQLCRAHGGGSRATKKANKKNINNNPGHFPPRPSEPIPFSTNVAQFQKPQNPPQGGFSVASL